MKKIINGIIASRNAVAAELDRCHADKHAKLVLGAKLEVWDEVMSYARLTNLHNGAPAVRLVEHIRNRAGEKRNYARVATSSKAQSVTFSKDAEAIEAWHQTWLEAMRLVA